MLSYHFCAQRHTSEKINFSNQIPHLNPVERIFDPVATDHLNRHEADNAVVEANADSDRIAGAAALKIFEIEKNPAIFLNIIHFCFMSP